MGSQRVRHDSAAAAAKSLQSCPTVRPQRRQPTRLPRPWDSPGKKTGVGCHFLLQCMKVKSESEVVQSCPTLRDPMDCSPPGFSAHGIFQVRVLEWGAIAFSNNVILLRHKKEWGWVICSEVGEPKVCCSESVQFSSVTQSCSTLCNPMDCSMSGFSVHYQLPEFAQTHVH